MTLDDMLKSLDLDAAPTPGESGSIRIESKTPVPAKTGEPNALVLDRWARRQGRQLHKQLGDELSETTPVRPIHDLDPVDLADLHQSVFDPAPEFMDEASCSDTLKWRYFNELNDTPGFHDLRRSTVLNDAATSLALEQLSEGLVNLRKSQEYGGEKGSDSTDDFCIGREAGKAVNQANQDIQDLADTTEGLGLGDGTGGTLDVTKAIQLYRDLRRNPDLQKIINLAGKYRLFGQSQQRRKISHGYDDLVGVTIGSDLPRLTQSEFLALGIPELEDDVCRRLLDNQAMITEWRGQEPVAKGPMIILVDESGSMNNVGSDGYSRIQHAKALSLAFAYMARQQGRWCALVGWSGASQRRSVILTPERWNPESLLAWIAEFWNGGTYPPIEDMFAIYESIGAPRGITDICYITDGVVCIDPAKIDGFNVWKKEINAKVITLVVSASPGDMTKISDEIHTIQAFGFNEAVGRVLSL